jgi:error-prone DNA polymerase
MVTGNVFSTVRALSPYVELTVRSNFSFLRGASPPATLIERAADLGYDAIAIADCDGLYGAVRAHLEAVERGVRLVLGCELTVRLSPPHGTLTVHVENHAGYTNLCRILTKSHELHPKGKARSPRPGIARNLYAGLPLELLGDTEGLWALAHGDLEEKEIEALKGAFGERLSLAVHRHFDGEDDHWLRRAEAIASSLDVPLCATNDVRYALRADKAVLDVLHCIREGTTLDRMGRAVACNAEAYLRSPDEMVRIFSDHPDWIARSRQIADACTFHLKQLEYHFPCVVVGETPDERLRRFTHEGARERYPNGVPPAVLEQVQKELVFIEKKKLAPYFLSVREIVDIAREKDILCQGRGSAANSAVCYCLFITAVDPATSNLLFERFLSAERNDPPDIDVDFEHERREEVIQEIYERYGRGRAAMVSEVITYRSKSALREVGKVFGLSLEQTGRMSGLVAWWDSLGDSSSTPEGFRRHAKSLRERVTNAGFDPEDRRVELVLAMARAIQGFPRHLSIHVGGFVLSADPLELIAPVEPATMKDRTIIPWDKDDLDALGFFKVDVLGLGMLTALRKMLDFVKDEPLFRGKDAIARLGSIPGEDKAVYEAISNADTVGVFQIESRAQMAMLPRLRPETFYDLVIEVAIVRPGPIQGGMVHPYLRRRRGEEPNVMPHPCLEPILKRTLGVPLFQEQVMEIAIVGAGYSGGEADQLRRDMSAWRRNGNLEKHKARLQRGFSARGISQEFIDRLFEQIRGFAEYGFPESHAASFALLVYASSWLKLHHPAEFAAALVNSQPMGFYSPSTILRDAQKHGVKVRPVSITESFWDCTLEDGEIRVGLRLVKGLGEEAGWRIEAARRGSPFESVEDLGVRAELTRRELDMLAASNALAPLIAERREAIWSVRAPRGEGLFAGVDSDEPKIALPPLPRDQALMLDYVHTGMSVDDHPMLLMRPSLSKKIKSAVDLLRIPHGSRASTAGMVICRQRPGTASGVVFLTLEDETGFSNLILYARVFEQQRHVATTSNLILAHGKVERDGDVVYLIPDKLEALSMQRTLPGMSRDFH